jgi:hypothetical protein
MKTTGVDNTRATRGCHDGCNTGLAASGQAGIELLLYPAC